MRVFLSAGELSGDQHAAGLIGALRALDPQVECRGFGGQRMRDAGAELLFPLADEPIIGVTAVLPRLLSFRRLLQQAVADMRAHRTDVLVLIDYPGFNLRLAEAARRAGIRDRLLHRAADLGVGSRAHRQDQALRGPDARGLRLRTGDLRAGRRAGAMGGTSTSGPARLRAAYAEFRARHLVPPGNQILGLFPGSRPAEVRRIFPVMLEAARRVLCRRAPGDADGRRGVESRSLGTWRPGSNGPGWMCRS